MSEAVYQVFPWRNADAVTVIDAYIAMRTKVEVLSSTGNVNKNSMTIFSSFRDKMDGKVYKIKQVLRATAI